MAQESLAGSCLCGAVRFDIKPPLTAFRYCHCSRCRKATGSAHAANIFVPAAQFAWQTGEAQTRLFNLPGAKRFAVRFCTECGTRVPHQVTGTENVLVPAGILDDSPAQMPDGSIFWGSRAPWFVETHDLPKHEAYSK